jgi:uncharacterized protein
MTGMRRIDRLMNEEETLSILKRGEYGILATVDQNGQPYGVPLNYVFLDNCIYYHGTQEGGSKHNNILNNDKVSFTIVGTTKVLPDKFSTLYESVIVFGEANLVNDKKEKSKAFKEFIKKYSPQFITEGEKYLGSAGTKTIIVRITIKSLTGKHKV